MSKVVIKEYWETRLPQVWYSKKKSYTIEWFNELAYQRYYHYFDYLPQVAEFAHHKDEKVLEIGVGVGTDLVQFAKNGAKVFGVDLTEQAIATTSKHLELNGLNCEWLKVGDAESLSFKNNTFDLVYSFGVLHHTPDIDKAIQEVHRVLKPGGKCIIMLYARGWKHYVKRVFLHGVIKGNLFKYGYNQTINKTTEVHGNSPLTYINSKKSNEELFYQFDEVQISRYRLGEFFDYAPYKTKKLPNIITKILYFLGAEQLFGENYIIKAFKGDNNSEKEAKKPTTWNVLWNSYKLSSDSK